MRILMTGKHLNIVLKALEYFFYLSKAIEVIQQLEIISKFQMINKKTKKKTKTK